MLVTDRLVPFFPEIMDIDFTAQLEESLDLVEEGDADWVKLVGKFNTQLDKVDVMTDSAVDAVSTVDVGVRRVTTVVTRPVQALAGLFTGARHATSAVRSGAGWRDAVDTGRAEAARREQDLADELRQADTP